MKYLHLPRRRLIELGCLAAVVVAAAGGLAQSQREAGSGPAPRKTEYLASITRVPRSGDGATSAPAVSRQTVEAVARPLTLRLTGSLAADERSEVGANVAGIVSETRVDRGSVVKKGDLLVQLDPRDSQYALDEGESAAEELRVRLALDEGATFDPDKVPEVEAARLTMEMAEKTYRRSESLKKDNAIALEAFDQAEMEYRTAVHRHHLTRMQAKELYRRYRSAMTHLVTLRKALEDCSIRAPFDGWVAERNVSLGERVISIFPGAKLVTVLKIDPLRLSLTVPQQDLAQIRAGQTVMFQADAFPGRTFTGTVRYITPAVSSDSRSLCVEALVPNADAVLRPGLFVTAQLQLDGKQTEIYVPQAAVCNRGDVAAVFAVRGGVIREQIVSLGEPAGGRARVLSGLAAGDVVVTTPDKVHDGDAAP